MREQDTEIQWLKASVSCAALLERLPPVWRLDRAESTRRSLKYRRGAGEIVIVNHDGRGWWDPLSEAQGRHLHPRPAPRPWPELRRGAPRAARLRGDRARVSRGPPRAAETAPASPSPSAGRGAAPVARLAGLALPHRAAGIAGAHPCRRGRGRRRPGRPAWQRLVRAPGRRGHADRDRDARPRLAQLFGGRRQDAVPPAGRPGPSAPRRGVRGGDRRAEPGGDRAAARRDTLYAATAGGMGPATVAALQQLLQGLAADPAGLLIAATDADPAGRRYAARLRSLATEARVRFDAILPPDGLNDWNDALRAMTPAP